MPLLDDAHRHRLRRGASHLPARRSRQRANVILWQTLRLLLTLPDTLERTPQELPLQLALATPLMSLKGYAAPEVEEPYSRAYAMHRAWAGTLHGWALSELGCLDEGIARMEESLEGMRLLGTELIRPEFLSLLAAAVAKRGDAQGALTLVTQALATVENTGEHYYDAELHRLKGTLLLSGSDDRVAEAEALIQRAIEIARAQGAGCFELRAATSLARLYLDRKRPEEARRSLAHVYAQSTEGFETRDLQEAREVLARCGGN